MLNGSSYSSGNTITLAANSAPASQAIYQSGRYVSSGSLNFAVPVANGSYTLRLHFADTSKTAAGQRRFDVQAEGVTILDNYDVFQRAGGRNRAIVEEATVTVSDGTLNLNLLKDIDDSMISGIEIIGN